MRISLTALGAGIALLLSGCGEKLTTLEAGGSTFAYPMMSRWSGEYAKSQPVPLRYLSIGSGLGIEKMTDRAIDFGCTDGPMNDKELERARAIGGEVIHLPLVMGAVVPAFNLEEAKEPLRLTGQVLAEIYLGKITRWNDPALVHLNPKAGLPDKPIAIAHRLDSSGTTYVFTEYLSLINPEWKTRFGASKTISWPVGIAEKGNEGVTGFVKRTAGSVGYIELSYGIQEKMTFALVQNRDGEFIKATSLAVTAAANSVKEVPDDLRFSINNASGKESYPICGTVWAVLYANQPAAKGKLVVDFLRWATHEGQVFADDMNYARLPPPFVTRVDAKLDQIKVGK